MQLIELIQIKFKIYHTFQTTMHLLFICLKDINVFISIAWLHKYIMVKQQ